MYQTMVRDDIGIMLSLTDMARTLMYPYLFGTLGHHDFYSRLRHDAEKTPVINNDMSVQRFEKTLQNYARTASIELCHCNLREIICACLSRSDDRTAEEVSPSDFIFELFCLKEKVYGLRLIPVDTTRSYEEQRGEAISRAIELLLGYYPFEVIARTPLFCELVRISEKSA